jgi:hypothetical protein
LLSVATTAKAEEARADRSQRFLTVVKMKQAASFMEVAFFFMLQIFDQSFRQLWSLAEE